jgi:hypothetical protein
MPEETFTSEAGRCRYCARPSRYRHYDASGEVREYCALHEAESQAIDIELLRSKKPNAKEGK